MKLYKTVTIPTSIFSKKLLGSSGFCQTAVTSNSPVNRKPTSPLDFDGAASLNSNVVVSLYFNPLARSQPLVAPAMATKITHTFQYMIDKVTETTWIYRSALSYEKTRRRIDRGSTRQFRYVIWQSYPSTDKHCYSMDSVMARL